MTSFINKTMFQKKKKRLPIRCQLCKLSKRISLSLCSKVKIMPRSLKIAKKRDECAWFFAVCSLLPLICSFLHSHNLEYDSSSEKNPRLIFYNEKDEVVKVRHKFGGSYQWAYRGSSRMSSLIFFLRCKVLWLLLLTSDLMSEQSLFEMVRHSRRLKGKLFKTGFSDRRTTSWY